MSVQIPQGSAADDPAATYAALDEAGCLVVRDTVDAEDACGRGADDAADRGRTTE